MSNKTETAVNPLFCQAVESIKNDNYLSKNIRAVAPAIFCSLGIKQKNEG
ncbi:MAG: hypothetical protein HIU83_16565 [Proteobacteria bacterium]|nr:hypothetical protein [Pseudomonadota bacterium]